MLEVFFGAVLSLMLMHPQPYMTQPYQPPMQYSQLPPQPLPPLPRDGARVEMVTHNGSLMALSVWPDKTIEIAYSTSIPTRSNTAAGGGSCRRTRR